MGCLQFETTAAIRLSVILQTAQLLFCQFSDYGVFFFVHLHDD